MALAKANLGYPTVITNTSTSAVYTVSGGKKAYIRGVIIYNASAGATTAQTVTIYLVPNSGGSAGTAAASNAIARVSLAPDDTYFFELQYPFILESNGDTIQVKNEGTPASNSINVVVVGDKES